MSALRDAVEEYLALRRALGAPIRAAASQLRGFVEFLECEGADFVTTQFALRWARQSTHAQPATWADRLGVVRRFAEWRSLTDPRTEIPSRRLLPHRRRRKPPYIYSDEEIERIVAQAAQLPSASGLRGPTYATLFGLLAASGLRLGEALALEFPPRIRKRAVSHPPVVDNVFVADAFGPPAFEMKRRRSGQHAGV